MPETHVNDPVRWHSNANEMRVLAEGAKDAATRRIMNRLADGWDMVSYGVPEEFQFCSTLLQVRTRDRLCHRFREE